MTAITYYSYVDCPLGQLFVHGDGQFLTGLFTQRHLDDPRGKWRPDASWQQSDAPFTAVREQLAEYFAGKRQEFDVPLKLGGTPFQRSVTASSQNASARRTRRARWAKRTGETPFRSSCRAIA
jgi:methylated-DNA-[protein]-cysteine S-methyltransferase